MIGRQISPPKTAVHRKLPTWEAMAVSWSEHLLTRSQNSVACVNRLNSNLLRQATRKIPKL